MSLVTHEEKIEKVKSFLLDSINEYMVIYGEASSGKFITVNQAYNILSDDQKSQLYLTIFRKGEKTTRLGEKTAPYKKTVILRSELDWQAEEYINDYEALSIKFLADPTYVQYSVYNLNNEFRKWLRSYPLEKLVYGQDDVLIYMIAMRDEFIVLNQALSRANVLMYNYGIKRQPISATFTDTEIVIIGVKYPRIL
jgi:curved DNA-binding protein CbpA